MTAAAPPTARDFVARIVHAPCCAAIVDAARLDAALASRAQVVFVLRGNGLDLAGLVERVHEAGKLIAVHLDLVDPEPDAVGRLVTLGATELASHQLGSHRWTVLQDPEGNEFCVAAEPFTG